MVQSGTDELTQERTLSMMVKKSIFNLDLRYVTKKIVPEYVLGLRFGKLFVMFLSVLP